MSVLKIVVYYEVMIAQERLHYRVRRSNFATHVCAVHTPRSHRRPTGRAQFCSEFPPVL